MTCAYTQKIGRLSQMLVSRGHQVFLYGGERNDFACTEHIPAITAATRRRWFGEETWRDKVFDRWETNDPCWSEFNAIVAGRIVERAETGDLLAIPIGVSHRGIAEIVSGLTCFESGVGYEGTFARYRVYESYAWMHWLWGKQGITDGRFFDAVIPNAFDPADFYFQEQKDDYLLFLGRHIDRKGTSVVAEIAKHHRVLSAGQGDPIPGVEHLGIVAGGNKAELIAGARALLAPTIYIEPFGGVAVEAQLCGTPVITTPWGAFTETVEHGVTGFHCNHLGDFLEAVDHVGKLNPHHIRERAEARYGVDAVADQYDSYLRLLATLQNNGWFETNPR